MKVFHLNLCPAGKQRDKHLLMKRKGGTGLNLSLMESVFFGLISGLTDILPVSGQAHRNLMLQLLGETGVNPLQMLLIHGGVLAALYYSCQNHILRMVRA